MPFLTGAFAMLIRGVMLLSGLVVAALLLVVAVTCGAALWLWGLVTGRKPVVRVAGVDPLAAMRAVMRARAAATRTRATAGGDRMGQRPGATPSRPARPHAVEVIDVDVREVPDRR